MSGTDPIAGIALRPAGEHDWGMIRRWLARPEIVRWWGPKATTEAEVMLALGSRQAICRIIEADGVPVGYAHALDAGLLGEPLPEGLAPGAWMIDLFVASPDHRGKGVGAVALSLVRDEVFATTLALEAAALVAVASERAVRACEDAGFRWRAVVQDRTKGPQWLLVASRPVPRQAALPLAGPGRRE
jgi:aminoglycoside 6'-N-acetyltransferase